MPDDRDIKPEEEVYDGEINDGEELLKETEESIKETVSDEQDKVDENVFHVRSSQGVSINGVGFCRGRYEIGQLVGIITIDKEIRDNILSLDAESIRTNPHLTM